MIGRTCGRYRIVSKLGEGGMGSVWKAEDTLLGRAVALKFLPEELASSPDARRRFLREARAASALDHPAIAAVFDTGEADGQVFIVLAYVDGETVTACVARGPFALPEVVRVGLAAAEALAHAHSRGVIHRDVTGRNIMLSREGRVLVVDFGLAHAKGCSTITHSGARMGTLAYMAPEVAQGGRADARSDIYGLGVVLYEMLTGSLPFASERPEALLLAAVNQPPEPPRIRRPEVPPALERLILRALGKRPALRQQTAKELASELESCAASARRARPPARPVIPRFRQGSVAVLPFESPSASGPEARAFATGLAAAVGARLARHEGIHVVSPSEVPRDLERLDPASAARDLGADLVLSGAVVRDGDRLRVRYALHGERVGPELVDRALQGTFEDLSALEERLAESVLENLGNLVTRSHPGLRPELHDAVAHDHYLQALGYLQRFNDEASVDGAIGLLERLSLQQPHAALVQSALGRAYLCKYKLTYDRIWEERAKNACERALALEPILPEVLLTRGQLDLATGRYASAVRDFQRSLKLRPDQPDALLGLAQVHEAAGHADEAEKAFRRAIELRPAYWGGYNKLGVFYFNRGRFADAVETWSRVVELVPDNERGHTNLGAGRYHIGDMPGAIEAYHRSLEIRPTASAYTGLGTVHFFLGNYVEAAAMFEKAVGLGPNDPRMWGNLGDAYRWMPHRQDQAAEAYERAIALVREKLRVNPRDPEALLRFAEWLAKTGRHRTAIQTIRRALRHHPDDVNCRFAAAMVFQIAGDREEALKWIANAMEGGYRAFELEHSPEFAALRDDPAFRTILKECRST